MEEWRPIWNFPGYEVSSLGRVRSVNRLSDRGYRVRGRVLRPSTDRKGYLRVNLYRDGTQYRRKVHRLVAWAFHGRPRAQTTADGRLRAQEVRHLDGDRRNNRRDNTLWGTAAQNHADSVFHGTNRIGGQKRGEQNPSAKLTEQQVKEIRESQEATCALARRYGVGKATIYDVRTRRKWSWLD